MWDGKKHVNIAGFVDHLAIGHGLYNDTGSCAANFIYTAVAIVGMLQLMIQAMSAAIGSSNKKAVWRHASYHFSKDHQ